MCNILIFAIGDKLWLEDSSLWLSLHKLSILTREGNCSLSLYCEGVLISP